MAKTSLPDSFVVRALTPADDRSNFRSGHIDLDRFFQRYAGQNQFRHHLGTTWIAVDGALILGFATVSAAHLEIEDLLVSLRKRLPAYPVPVLRLARLAVADNTRGLGVGRALLRTVFVLAHRMSNDFGCIGAVVDAKPDALAFHERLGFQAFSPAKGALGDRPAPTPMFLELAAIAEITKKRK